MKIIVSNDEELFETLFLNSWGKSEKITIFLHEGIYNMVNIKKMMKRRKRILSLFYNKKKSQARRNK